MSNLLPGRITWETWGWLFTNVDAWRPAVAAVWSQSPALMSLTGPPEDRIETGFPGTCAVFVVGREAVVKFFPPFARQDYERERYCLRHLEAVPKRPLLLAEGILSDRLDWPYLVTRFVPENAWRDQRSGLSRGAQLGVATQLGQVLAVLHRQPLGRGPAWPSVEAWARLLAERRGGSPAELTRLTSLPPAVVQEAADVLAGQESLTAAQPVIVHADVTEDHVLTEKQGLGWQLACLIDWADAEVAVPAYEWVALWFSFCDRDPGLLRAVLSAYDPEATLDAVFVRQLLAATLVHRFGPRIIAETLTAEEQRDCESLDALSGRLFAGLP